MTASAPRLPATAWAQRKDRILLSLDINGCQARGPVLRVEPADHVVFEAQGAAGESYRLELDLRGELNAASCRVASVGPRQVSLLLMKKAAGPHWDRLLESPGKLPNHIKVDWNRWKDEENDVDQDDFDLGSMGDLAKYDDPLAKDVDSDDEDLPDLSKPI